MHCISVRLRMSLSWTSISNLITMTLIIMIFIGVNARYSIEFVESVLLRESEKKFWFFFHEKVLLIEWRVQVLLLPTFYYVKYKRFGCLTGIFVVRACTHHFFLFKKYIHGAFLTISFYYFIVDFTRRKNMDFVFEKLKINEIRKIEINWANRARTFHI